MKAALPLGALVIGIVIGWLIKNIPGGAEVSHMPSSETQGGAATANASALAAGPAGGSAQAFGKSHDRPSKEAQDELPKMQIEAVTKHLMDSMQEQQTKRHEERIAKLVDKLGLDASQEAKLRDYFKQQAEATKVTVGDDGKSVQMTQRNDGKSLEDFLKDLLTDSQEQDYAKMKEAERDQRVEARTLREMASLTQAVELRPEQRDAVYSILQEQARGDESAPGPKMFNAGMLAPPMEAGEEGSSVDAVMSFRMAGSDAFGSDESAIEQARQQYQAQIDEKVNSMSGVLDEKQLEQYRASLEKGMVMLPR